MFPCSKGHFIRAYLDDLKFHPAGLLTYLLLKKADRVEFFSNPAGLFRSAILLGTSEYLSLVKVIVKSWLVRNPKCEFKKIVPPKALTARLLAEFKVRSH